MEHAHYIVIFSISEMKTKKKNQNDAKQLGAFKKVSHIN